MMRLVLLGQITYIGKPMMTLTSNYVTLGKFSTFPNLSSLIGKKGVKIESTSEYCCKDEKKDNVCKALKFLAIVRI